MAALIVSDRMASMTGGEVVIDGGACPAGFIQVDVALAVRPKRTSIDLG